MKEANRLSNLPSASGKHSFSVMNPSTGEQVSQAPNQNCSDLNNMVKAAKIAFESWSKQPDSVRQAACNDIAQAIGDHAEQLALLLTKEQGKPLAGLGSRFEIGAAQAWASHTASMSLPVQVLQDDSEGKVELHRTPIGVVGSITPWNWPVMIAVWHLLPAIRTGNTVIIKPSPYTPLSTILLVEIINKVLPAGVVNVITSDDETDNLGAAMSSHPDIRKLVFTGSCETGKKVYASAAQTIKRLTLELGGNDAGIVLPDVDPQEIAQGLFWGAFINNGQTCAAMKRLFVHEDVYEQVCQALTDVALQIPLGDGQNEDSALGPIAHQQQFDKVKQLVATASLKGRVLCGGKPGEGLFFPPTIIADLSPQDPLVVEEQFGPALPIIKYSNIEDAITMANDSENGLGGSVWSSDIERAKQIASQLQCGSVWINKHGALQPNVPFGGVKSSGLGVEFAEQGLCEYTDIKVIYS